MSYLQLGRTAWRLFRSDSRTDTYLAVVVAVVAGVFLFFQARRDDA